LFEITLIICLGIALVISLLANAALVLLFLIAASFAFRMSNIIVRIEDAIEDALDIFDERYQSLSEILEKPVFFDSAEVRQAIEDIESSRGAILYVSNILTSAIDESAIEELDEEDTSGRM
jgi:hypothetical protein